MAVNANGRYVFSRKRFGRLLIWGLIILFCVLFLGFGEWNPRILFPLAAITSIILIVYEWVSTVYKRSYSENPNKLCFFPLQIELLPMERHEYFNREAVNRLMADLKDLHYKAFGLYTVDRITETNIIAFLHRDEHSYAIIYDQRYVGVWIDLFCVCESGICITYTSSKILDVNNPPDNLIVEYREDFSPKELYARFAASNSDVKRLRLSKERFTYTFEDYLIKDRRLIIRSFEERKRRDKEIRDEFLRQSDWSAAELDSKKDNVVFIHNYLNTIEAIDLYLDGLYLLNDEYVEEREKVESIFEKKLPIDAFAQLVNTESGKNFKEVVRLDKPVKTVVYFFSAFAD